MQRDSSLLTLGSPTSSDTSTLDSTVARSAPQSSFSNDDDSSLLYDALMPEAEDSIGPVTTISRTPIWTDIQIDSKDSKYFHFFLHHMKQFIPYTNLFPKAMDDIFARTTRSKPLRHAVLSLSAIFVDTYFRRPLIRALVHKQEAFISLQRCLSLQEIDEDVAIAVFLMLFMDTFNGKEIAQGHLRGLLLVLKELNIDSSEAGVSNWDKASPVVLLVWRIALRLDAMIATIQDATPVFPPFPAEYNEMQRKWVAGLAIDGMRAECGIASFALDNLYQRACHWTREFDAMCNSPEYKNDPAAREAIETMIRTRISILRLEHAGWIEQPSCALALQMELLAQKGEIPPNIPQFLDYPPLYIYNRKFSLLLNEWRTYYLFISVVAVPVTMRRHTVIALNHSIEICRTHAALSIPPANRNFGKEFFAVLSAGYAFAGGKRFQREFNWVRRRIARIVEMKNPLLKRFQHFLDKMKDFKNISPEWDEFDEDIFM